MTTPDKELRAADLARLAELLAKREALLAEYAATTDLDARRDIDPKIKVVSGTIIAALPALLAMAREREALARDAARYRWWRENAQALDDNWMTEIAFSYQLNCIGKTTAELFERIADAAMGAQP